MWDNKSCFDVSEECTAFIFRLTGADSDGCWSDWKEEMVWLCGKITGVLGKGTGNKFFIEPVGVGSLKWDIVGVTVCVCCNCTYYLFKPSVLFLSLWSKYDYLDDGPKTETCCKLMCK